MIIVCLVGWFWCFCELAGEGLQRMTTMIEENCDLWYIWVFFVLHEVMEYHIKIYVH